MQEGDRLVILQRRRGFAEPGRDQSSLPGDCQRIERRLLQ